MLQDPSVLFPQAAHNSSQHGIPGTAPHLSSAGTVGYEQYDPPSSKPEKADAIVTAVDYRAILLIAVLPPFLVLLAFGGKLALLVMCFGGLICYIFDLLGSIEVKQPILFAF